ncbi:phage tail terminator-like protein [Pseudomonas atacamensis]|uniref:phage tail terminator-like protein n=1 Tax=Pseudomonas atacamensis TaxID=2565368 RepID=UPI001F3209CC|nr:phage tail terminator-like protein [Pseudomonas atacamensis]
MTFEQIRALITARMVAFTGIDQERIDYPNQPKVFTPPATGLWCRLNIQYASAFMAGMADRPHTRKPGQISIQCFARERTGTKAINELADALEAHFAYWMSGDLECVEASQVVAGEFEGFYQINVNIRFRAG